MNQSLWDFVFNFFADTAGIEQGLDAGERAGSQMEDALNLCDDAAQRVTRELREAGDAAVNASRDTDRLDRSLDDANRDAQDLNDTLTRTDRLADSMAGHLRGWALELTGIVGGALALGSVLGNAAEVTQYSLEMGTLAERAGLAVETFGALAAAARNIGGEFTEGEIFSAIERLQTETDDVYNTLAEFQRQIQGLDSNAAIRLGDEIGIDPVLVDVLQRANVSLEELTDNYVRLGGLTREQLDQLRLASQAWQQLRQVYDSLTRQLIVGISPGLQTVTELLTQFVRWISDNSGLVEGFFVGTAAAITARYLPAVIRAVIATYALIAPYLLIAAAVAAVGVAVALLWNDFQVFRNGGDSVIGSLIERFPVLGEMIAKVGEIINNLKIPFNALLEFFRGVFEVGLANSISNASGYVSDFINRLMETYPALAPVLELLGSALNILGGALAAIADVATSVASGFVMFMLSMVNALVLLFSSPRAALEELKNAYSTLFDGLLSRLPDAAQFFASLQEYAAQFFAFLRSEFPILDKLASFLGIDIAPQALPEIEPPRAAAPGADNELVLPDGSSLRSPQRGERGVEDRLGDMTMSAGSTVAPLYEGNSGRPAGTDNIAQALPQPQDNVALELPDSYEVPDVVATMDDIRVIVEDTRQEVAAATDESREVNNTITENNINQDNRQVSKSVVVQVGDINVKTDAAVSEAMADEIRRTVTDALTDIADEYNDGMQ